MKNIEPVALNPLVESGVEKMIRVIRGKQVLLDRDLAHLYGVETKRINEQVKRNIERFPEEFCFQLEKDEFENWKSQFATSNSDKMGLRKLPFAFSEQGVAMLIRQAQRRIVLVDNYVDETILLMMLKRNKGVSVTIYTYDKSKIFELDLQMFIDDTSYHFGASLKDLGKKTFFFSKEDFSLEEVLNKSKNL